MEFKVPSRNGALVPLESYDRDQLSTLDIVWSNNFEGEAICSTQATRKESEFYKGAPPQWLNFYCAEKTGSLYVKRDLYNNLNSEIVKSKTKHFSIVKVNLHHEPGTGGSTLAMQVLWDLRKELKCAKVRDSAVDTSTVAEQVVRLFNTPNQNTVLLLLDNKKMSNEATFVTNLENDLNDVINTKTVTATIPVVIILNCLRQHDLVETESPNSSYLRASLSDHEKSSFKSQQKIISKRHAEHHKFHAFNIIQSGFDPSYAEEACSVLPTLKRNEIPRNAELLAFLSLVNTYVPGSYLPHDLCQKFLQKGDNLLDDFSLEQQMKPFSSVLVVFSTQEEEDRKKVRIVHPMIAQKCLELIVKAGLTRSNITRKLLEEFWRDEIQDLLKTIITKRESSLNGQEKFSKLILDMTEEGTDQCISVLELVSNKFKEDPFYPQVLARFYSLNILNYNEAKKWSEIARKRDEGNSFILDTLGQVHKHHLISIIKTEQSPKEYVRQILHVGSLAVKAFEDEVKAAKKQQEAKMQDLDTRSKLNLFNSRGLFGYMHVANMILKNICKKDPEWERVLRREVSPDNVLSRFQSCSEYKRFITGLRDGVQEKFEFFQWYLLYSKPSIYKDEPENIWETANKCHNKYVQQSVSQKPPEQILKEKKVNTFAGQLRFFQNRDVTNLEENAKLWAQIYSNKQSEVNAVNYVLANIILSQENATFKVLRRELQALLQEVWKSEASNRSPEFYLLVLLLFWPDDEQSLSTQDLSQCVGFLGESYKNTYEKYLRKRLLLPLFFLGEGPVLLPTDLVKQLIEGRARKEIPDLRRVQGEVKKCRVFALRGSEQIEVSPHPPTNICGEGKVSFYLGFTIKGPAAFDIRY